MNKISISNLAFQSADLNKVLSSLSRAGASGIEVAPTKIAEWDSLTNSSLREYRSLLADHNLSVSSLQAILYGMPNVELLREVGQFENLCIHMKRIGETANVLGAEVAVLGAPKQRSRGDLTEAEAFKLGVDRLRLLADIAHEHGIVIGLEPVPEVYGCDFLTNWEQVNDMIQQVDHPGLRVHLDTACVMLGGGNITEAIHATSTRLVHFHISEPKLQSFKSPIAEHTEASEALIEIKYDGWLVIEMLAHDELDDQASIDAVMFAKATYMA
ncbi:sugar phosphate isomerase/epimerase family protein [Rhizobium oryziradicis]|uniref:Xylose isomerase-like TIM barrel domain-containing protein n=1 Tax=Rhizobium oryziradicis TaxID=1867956 RepID=A0A1Q8ZSI5_9HYPH|nr:sugar phosphate isomerase/epimerase family protein [Rhizobium oryziradicis]OLP44886.1 hypothetical protein BJF95_04675 [Rhizobium oryziradicis]